MIKNHYTNIYVDHCYVCNSTNKLETHHINHQKDFKQTINGLIKDDKKHIVKDAEANLVVLCDICHDKIHNNTLSITKLVNSSEGIKAL